jgi:quercetin dioxygenase-like cupin family protein
VIPVAIVVAALAAFTGHAQAPAHDVDRWWTPQNEALTAAPQHHTLLFENDEVRVLTVTIAPGVKEPLHAHRYASVIYDEQPSHLVEYLADGTKVDRGVRTQGGARWLPVGPPHALENVGTTPLRIVRVELKKAR